MTESCGIRETLEADNDACGMTTASRATALLTAAGQQAARKLAAARHV